MVLSVYALCFALPAPLPSDEGELGAFVEEGAIDSFQYEQLLVFYALPLSVPQGELALLARVFPDIAELLPDRETLEEYQPFDNKQIQRLFGDYPVLADFEPVLRFNASPSAAASNGEAIFGIHKSGISELRGQRVRFRQKSSTVSTEGGITLSDTGALWQNRRADLTLGGAGIQAGNFKQPMPGELFFGRFSPLGDDDKDIASNWFYAASNTWNGLSVDMQKIPGLPMAGAGAFAHVRPGERGAGGGFDLRVNKQWRMYAGVSGFQMEYAATEEESSSPEYNEEDLSADRPPSAPVYGGYSYAAHLYGE
jgi:hypothetical protein